MMFKTALIFVFLAIFAIVAVAQQEENIVIDEDAGAGSTTVAADAGGSTQDGGTSDSSPSGECEDEITDCKKTAYECTDIKYKPIMCGMCKKTCNLCPSSNGTDPCAGVVTVAPPPTTPPTAGPDECIDTASDCGKTAYECKNSLYKPLMCKYCKKTCNLCEDPACLA